MRQVTIPLPSRTPLTCLTMSIFTSYKKFLAVSTAAAAILALPAQVASAMPDTLPKGSPPLVRDLVLTDMYYTDDNSYIILNFDADGARLGSGDDLLGWARIHYVVSLRLDNGKYRGIGIREQKITSDINEGLIAEEAERLQLPQAMLARIVQAHEKQHVKDYQKYPLMDFSQIDACKCPPARPNSSGSVQREALMEEIDKLPLPVDQNNKKITLEEQYKTNIDLMEGRAVHAEYKAFIQEIKDAFKVINDYKRYSGNLAKLNEKLERKKEENASTEQVIKEISATEGHLAKLKPKYEELDKCGGLKRFEEINPNQRFKKSKDNSPQYANLAEQFFVEKMIGNAIISGSKTPYGEAYKRYKEDKHPDRTMKEQYEGMKALVAQCLIWHYPRAISLNNGVFKKYKIKGRPVCRPCAVQDTLGLKCKRPWCANYGNWPSQYVQQKGDYIPMSYEDPFQEAVDKQSDGNE